ncbi:inner centromere protein A [Copidosoma floridanum]|uniref:inner centromere protein A n=1 Tax=Copidosoma floridanum TaxID=29053 RepID=UPI0006C98D61|nr:inner centromere protein A [Copidosoma floridanum]
MDKKTAIQMMQSDFARISQEKENLSKQLKDSEEDVRKYMRELLSQVKTGSLPILSKTPKVSKKKNTKIQSIPENEEMEVDSSVSSRNDTESVLEMSDARPGRAKRGASIKAANSIRKQQSINLTSKLRRPSKEDSESPSKESRIKQSKASLDSSDDEDIRPSKPIATNKKMRSKDKKNNTASEVECAFVHSTLVNENEKSVLTKKKKRKLEDQDADQDSTLKSDKSSDETSKTGQAKKARYINSTPKNEEKVAEEINVSDKRNTESKRFTRSSMSSIINAPGARRNKKNVINETVDMSNVDETLASMYEDAINKPISNSTMNPNAAMNLERIMNVTVSIEPLPSKTVMNETVTLKNSVFKEPISNKKVNATQTMVEAKDSRDDKTPKNSETIRKSHRNMNTTQQNKRIDQFNDFITDDESSPERKRRRSTVQRRSTRSNNNSLLSDEDEIQRTPPQAATKIKDAKLASTVKSTYKPAALFSPYAKDSVKKRVEAFEQVAISPKQVETEVVARVTRTKTRALAAASETPTPSKSYKLASEKATKIPMAKHKDYDDVKENESSNIVRSKKTNSLEQLVQKQSRTTPLGKSRLLTTTYQFSTPSNAPVNAYGKALTGPRGNIVTHVDSFIQPTKSASKSIDKASEERRRRAHDEDARQKREALLKVQAEEKRRKREEKELKNKLAREAKEKLELEKRLKAEREREEKARIAQQMQEKQKEEMEKRRIAQIQRAQEKEEKRKQEELLRMQRLQEQEEQERLLAEQKRREQEMEKRKQAMKMKSQMEKAVQQAKVKAMAAQKQGANNYKIDSDPDEEDTDDECKPKHQIPQWALKNIRQAQLAMQQCIPMGSVLKFFDAKKCTPDLRDLFKGIDPKKLKRTSSAIWKTPPRFSMMNRSIITD